MSDDILGVDIEGEERVERGLARLAEEMADARKPLQRAGEILSASTGKRFQEGGPGWADVQEKTRKQRKGDKSAPPLHDMGALEKAATATRPGVPGAIYELTPNGLIKGVEGPGVRALQEGYAPGGLSGPGHGTPARPFLLATDEDEREIGQEWDDHLDRLLADLL